MKEKLILVVKLIKNNCFILWKNLNFRILFFSLILMILGLLTKKLTALAFIFYFLSYIIICVKMINELIKDSKYHQMNIQSILILIITFGLFILKHYIEAIITINLFVLSCFLIKKLTNKLNLILNPKNMFVHLVIQNKTKTVPLKKVKINDLIIIKPREIIPIDGVVIDGKSFVEYANSSSNSNKHIVTINDIIISGAKNGDGVLKIKVTKGLNDSTLFKINQLIKNNIGPKTKLEEISIKLDRYYPIILSLISVLVFIIFCLVLKQDFKIWFYRLLAGLVIIQPHYFLKMIGLSHYSAFQCLFKKGMFIKNSKQLEDISNMKSIIFDQRGTLTKNNLNVVKIVPNKSIEEQELLEMFCYGTYSSKSPLYQAISNFNQLKINNSLLTDYQEFDHDNIKVFLNNRELIIGQSEYLKENQYKVKKFKEKRQTIHIGYDKEYLGYLVIGNQINPNSKKTIYQLKRYGIDNIVMLSSDDKNITKEIAEQLSISAYYASLTLEKKKEYVQKVKNNFQVNSKVGYVTMKDDINQSLNLADLNFIFEDIDNDLSFDNNQEINIINKDPMVIAQSMSIVKNIKIVFLINFIVSIIWQLASLVLSLIGIIKIWEIMLINIIINLLIIINNILLLKCKS